MNREQFQHWCHQSVVPTVQTLTYVQKPLIMGVLNVTPDSFSDGGDFLNVSHAYDRAQEMIAEGVDIIDIGGESSKPGAVPVSSAEELARVIPVIERIRAASDVCISIDTYKAEVMDAAVSAGATLINDIKALTDKGALATAARLNVPVCLMHMRGEPQSMQNNPHYSMDVVEEINDFFQQRITACVHAGISLEHLILDPGFGFGKSVAHNLCILNRLGEFQQHHLRLLLGVSRKSTLGAVLQRQVFELLPGGLALAVFAALQGVTIIRTHDVDATSQALKMIHAIVGSSTGV